MYYVLSVAYLSLLSRFILFSIYGYFYLLHKIGFLSTHDGKHRTIFDLAGSLVVGDFHTFVEDNHDLRFYSCRPVNLSLQLLKRSIILNGDIVRLFAVFQRNLLRHWVSSKD
jgi:hypothetical protein